MPPNPSYAPRDVYVQTQYYNYQENGTWPLTNWVISAGMTQAAATITATLHSAHIEGVGTLGPVGGFDIKVTANGTYPTFTVVYVSSDTSVNGKSFIGTTNTTNTYKIPSNTSYGITTPTTKRSIAIYIQRLGSTDLYLGTVVQHGDH